MTPEQILAFLLETFPGRVSLACSFQKEESVLLDMLFALEPKARVFALDTHYLFAETHDVDPHVLHGRPPFCIRYMGVGPSSHAGSLRIASVATAIPPAAATTSPVRKMRVRGDPQSTAAGYRPTAIRPRSPNAA